MRTKRVLLPLHRRNLKIFALWLEQKFGPVYVLSFVLNENDVLERRKGTLYKDFINCRKAER